jgi:hypothetical protein
MKDKRLLCWLLGVTALCCGFVWTQIGKAGPFTPPQLFPIAGQWPGDAGGFRLLQPPPRLEPRTEPRTEPKGEDEEEPRSEGPPPGLRKLTSEEINRLRYMELRGMRLSTEQPDRVTVKVPRPAVDDFLLDMEGDATFREHMRRLSGSVGQKARQAFLRLSAPLKLHYMATYKGSKYADRVEISSDPEVFMDFKKNVMPTVVRNCATTACHGSPDKEFGRFELFNDPKKSAATTYANFLMLSEIQVNGHHMIDRGQPENSLLITYMLPPEDVRPELRHPGNVIFKPVFRTPTAIKCKRIRNWIVSLKHPAENYGIHFFPPEPTSRAADEDEIPPEVKPGREQEKKPETGSVRPGQQPPPPNQPDSRP